MYNYTVDKQLLRLLYIQHNKIYTTLAHELNGTKNFKDQTLNKRIDDTPYLWIIKIRFSLNFIN